MTPPPGSNTAASRVIVNSDDRGHLLGPFYVGAGETLVQRFTSPGVFEGACAVHPSDRLVLDVRA